MAKFEISYAKTLDFEGVYSLSNFDRGWETWMGISRKYHPEWEGWTIVDSIKSRNIDRSLIGAKLIVNNNLLSLTHEFYYETFFKKMFLDKIEEQSLCDELFDTAVNQGCCSAVKYLQKALNLLNNNELYYSNIAEDGVMGDKTLSTISAYLLARNSSTNIRTLLKAINGFQFLRYVEICKNDSSQEVNFYGWLKRV